VYFVQLHFSLEHCVVGGDMASSFNFDEELAIIRVVLEGQSTMDETQDQLPRLLQMIGDQDSLRLLIDYREPGNLPNPKRRALIALFAGQLNENIAKVAISCSTQIRQDIAPVWEVMRSRGIPAEFFDDVKAAEAWLTDKTD
jgi:hypothetical protein